jgi:chromate transport protein ChrA
LTVAVVLAFAIEIGQKQTNTGNMEFWDIIYGINGFLFFFTIFVVILLIVKIAKKYYFVKNPEVKLSDRDM